MYPANFTQKEAVQIQKKTKYYNLNDIVYDIHWHTGCSMNDISKVIHSLTDVVKDKLSEPEDKVEIRVFNGLKISSEQIPSRRKGEVSLLLNSSFSDSFAREVRQLYKDKSQIDNI